MAIIKCPNGHYYDDKRNSTCPYCEKVDNGNFDRSVLNEQLTSYMPSDDDDNVQLTEGYGEFVTEYEKTIGIFTDESQNVLTAGWLICVKGVEKGKSYVLNSGRNFAGRSFDMDILLSGDDSVSRENHFSIVYDPKSVTFYLVSGSGHTYLNGNAVSNQAEIFEGDIIQAGISEYMFIPFCKEGRVWN